jgi:germination protein M
MQKSEGNGRKLIIYAVLLAIIFVMIPVFYWIAVTHDEENRNRLLIDVYYLDTVTFNLINEPHNIRQGTEEEMIRAAYAMLSNEPNNANLRSVVPYALSLNEDGIQLSGRTARLDFDESYFDMPPSEEIPFLSAVTWTLTGFDFVLNILITVDGQFLDSTSGTRINNLNRTLVSLNETINPDKEEPYILTLYIPNDNNNLSRVARMVYINPDLPITRFIVEELLPSDVRLLVTPHTEGDICTVNLSMNFLDRLAADPVQERLLIYSIVNSLVELDGISKVQFLFDSGKADEITGEVDINQVFERDETLIE